jgi:hypothetical protein
MAPVEGAEEPVAAEVVPERAEREPAAANPASAEPAPEDEPAAADLASAEPGPEDEPAVEPAPARAGRRARPRPQPADHGTVVIATPGGWGDVYLGARRLGRAPGVFQVPPGRSVLRVLPLGREPARQVTVQVAAGGTTRAVVSID